MHYVRFLIRSTLVKPRMSLSRFPLVRFSTLNTPQDSYRNYISLLGVKSLSNNYTIDGPAVGFDVKKMYSFVVITHRGITTLVHKVGQFYERIGMGRFLIFKNRVGKETNGDAFARNGFSLDWFSIQ